jgi:hypothetical protein
MAEKFSELSSEVAKSWWAKLTPEEKRARAQKAIQARWAKGSKSAKTGASKESGQ